MQEIYDNLSKDGSLSSSLLASELKKRINFDYKKFGCNKFNDFIKKFQTNFDYEMKEKEGNSQLNMYVKLKNN